ncbi:mannitol-1-phosphate 5-dehydrogenase [Diaminobutyricimonas sp. LJ205]|uniref:mannitol-1-phosphate 5-dehydrogenase n=1 Tax=Diaminobutyricimonas sp. LJ205 TaxID=2683590 RepID=UPI0012F48244|nr:mannitol-1-phosphate 5-dehydrogenase [Diaminobutyricimonas sp. LJ205]
MAKTAVHFGAGNIGRGFVAQFLHASGYEVVFVDVNEELIRALQAQPSYTVHEMGAGATESVVDGYRAINSRTHEADVIAEIAAADIVTTAVGPRVLPFVAPLIARGIAGRTAPEPLTVIACENAVNASSTLAAEVHRVNPDASAAFANCAIDRIVPEQPGGLDVTLEAFSEWVVDRTPFPGNPPELHGVIWVDDLTPYIERKLFTVNTGHAAAAYHGTIAGIVTIREALATPAVAEEVRAVLAETKALLVDKHGFSADEQQAYIDKTIQRVANPHLPDTCERVGRNPLRKLSRYERFIGPAAQLAERGHETSALMRAVGAALQFHSPDDAESIELRELLASNRTAAELAVEITGLDPEHRLFPAVVTAFEERAGG